MLELTDIINAEILKDLEKTCANLLEITSLATESFNSNKSDKLKEAFKKAKTVHKSENKILEKIVKELQDNKRAKYIITIPSHLERIGDNLESVLNCINIKITESLMFSDKAVKEINLLFSISSDILKCIKDMFRVRNEILIKTANNETEKLARIASDYATEHEERLIRGLCQPKTSSIFLDMLDSLKSMAQHSKDITLTISKMP